MSAVAALAGRDRGQKFELRFGLDVDAENAVVDGEREFALGLAHAGEHDLLRRNAGGAGAQQFAFGDHVGAGAEPGQRRDHRLVGVGLERVADERVDVGEGAGEHPVVPLQGRARIAVERGADRLGQRDQIDGLGAEHAVAVGEVMHGACLEHQPAEWKPVSEGSAAPIEDWDQKRASVRPGSAESRAATAAAGRGEMASSGPAWPRDCRAGRSRSWQWSLAKSAVRRTHRQAQKRPARGAARSTRPGPVESLSVRAEFQGSRCARRRTGSAAATAAIPKSEYRATKSQGPPHESLVTA